MYNFAFFQFYAMMKLSYENEYYLHKALICSVLLTDYLGLSTYQMEFLAIS